MRAPRIGNLQFVICKVLRLDSPGPRTNNRDAESVESEKPSADRR